MQIVHVQIDANEAQAVYVDGVRHEALSAEVMRVMDSFNAPLTDRDHYMAGTIEALATEVDAFHADFTWFQANKYRWPEQLSDVVRDEGDRTSYLERTGNLPEAQLAALAALRTENDNNFANVEELPSTIEGDGTVLVSFTFETPVRYVRVHPDGAVTQVVLEDTDGGMTHAQKLSLAILRSDESLEAGEITETLEEDGTLTILGTPTSTLDEESHIRETVTPVYYITPDGQVAGSERTHRDFDDTPEGQRMRQAIAEIYEPQEV